MRGRLLLLLGANALKGLRSGIGITIRQNDKLISMLEVLVLHKIISGLKIANDVCYKIVGVAYKLSRGLQNLVLGSRGIDP